MAEGNDESLKIGGNKNIEMSEPLISTTSFSSSSFPPPTVTRANSGLKPSTWLASFSMNEYGINCNNMNLEVVSLV